MSRANQAIVRGIVVVVVCLAAAGAAWAGTIKRHSFSHNLAAGDFDGDGAAEIGWILPNGDIQLYSPSLGLARTVTGANAYAVAAGDLTANGDGLDELVYLKRSDPNPAADQQIRVYSPAFWTDTQHSGAAGAASKLTAGDWNNDGDDGIVVLSRVNALWGSEPTGGGPLWDSPAGVGALASWTAADVNPGRAGAEFTGFNTGSVHYNYNGGTSNSYTATGGSGLNAIAAGNVNAAAAGDEVLASVRGTELWRWNSAAGWARLPGGGVGVGAGSLTGSLDEWLVIGNAPNWNIYRYAGNSAWQQVGSSGNWGDFVAADFDGDGNDEIFALKRDGTPYYYKQGVTADFQPVAVPASPAPLPVSAGARLWLDASEAATIVPDGSGNVQMWIDKSGAGNHATQPTAGERPVLNPTAMNGQPAVRFDNANNEGLSVADTLSLGRPYTVFTVDQYYGAEQRRTLQSRDGGFNWLTGKWGGRNAYYAGGFVNDPDANWAGTGNVAIGDAVGNATSSRYWINGIDRTTNAGPTGSPGHLGLGSEGTYNEQSQADVAEVIVFDRALSHYERSQVGLYLREKYGVGGYTGYNTHLATRAQAFIGGDPSEGLDMQGTFVHAVNVSGPAGAQVGNATFTNDAGLVTAEYDLPTWNNPNYGASADDNALEGVMQSIRWTDSNDGGLETLSADLPNLVPGRTYKVQMLFGDSGTSRHFAVDIEGSRVMGDFQMGSMSGTTQNRGVVITHEFVATDNTLNIVLDGQGLSPDDINPLLQAVTVEDRGVTGKTWAGTFTGGDAGEGLRMGGDFLYAVNLRGPGGLKVGGATFTADNATPGCTVNAENEILNWIGPNYGGTANDDNLETVMQSIRWTATNYRGEALSVDLEGLEIGQDYLLQLLFGENPSSRGFDVVINDVLVADNFSPTAEGVSADVGVALFHRFVAQDDELHIVLDGLPTPFGDRNPILQGLTLQAIPEPATMVLLALGTLALLPRLRRRR